MITYWPTLRTGEYSKAPRLGPLGLAGQTAEPEGASGGQPVPE
jgi:hypothetical protein